MKHVDVIVTQSEERQHLLERLLATVHGINASNGSGTEAETARLAIAFPDWQDAVFASGKMVRPGNPGQRLRVFGSEEELGLLLASPCVSIASKMGDVRTVGPAEVPSVHAWVRFVRDRSYERAKSPAVLRRRAARAGVAVRDLPCDRPSPPREPHHCFSYTSRTNGQSFALRVRRCKPEDTNGYWSQALNAYGLVQDEGSLPAF